MSKKPEKIKGVVLNKIAKMTQQECLNFKDFYFLVPEIEICLKYFLDKKIS